MFEPHDSVSVADAMQHSLVHSRLPEIVRSLEHQTEAQRWRHPYVGPSSSSAELVSPMRGSAPSRWKTEAAHLLCPESAKPSYFASVADSADAKLAVPANSAAAVAVVASTDSASFEPHVPLH